VVRRSGVVSAVITVVAVLVAIAIATQFDEADEDDSGSVEATAWADSVCTSLGDWRTSISPLADVGAGELTPELFEEKLDEARSATDDLVDSLKGIGPPAVASGNDVEQALDDSADGLRESYESLRLAAQDALDAETPAAFLQELATLRPELQAISQQVEDTVASLQSASLFGESSAELEQAFADAESCQSLRGEG
jgi:hypothetical protein